MNMFVKFSQFLQSAHESDVLWKAFCNHPDEDYGDQICLSETDQSETA